MAWTRRGEGERDVDARDTARATKQPITMRCRTGGQFDMNVAYSSPVMPAAAVMTDQRFKNKNTIGICIVKAKLPDEISKFKIEVRTE
ncbi:hypothetical protein E5D57_008944 [Metarhizium anisopliae]|nr:hypothetical protein E5D57_008944 [Metarhizium anisopliae]